MIFNWVSHWVANISYSTLALHSLFKPGCISAFPRNWTKRFPQTCLLGFCTPIKAINAKICIRHLAYFNFMKGPSMNFPLKVPPDQMVFFFCPEESLVNLLSAKQLRNKDGGRTQRYCFVQVQANQTDGRMMFFNRHRRCLIACCQVISFYSYPWDIGPATPGLLNCFCTWPTVRTHMKSWTSTHVIICIKKLLF